MLSKYGMDNIIVTIVLGSFLILMGFFFHRTWLCFPLELCGFLLIIFTMIFFRDPDRTIPEYALNDKSVILSPADGKVLEIIEEHEDVYIKDSCKRISIFLSILDVHVNRTPTAGVVEYFEYHPGKYMIAFNPKSSLKNEQTHIGVSNKYGKVFFKQIVGILARRIVWELNVGDTLEVGQKFGMMKFGSRMDVAVPVDSQIFVKPGDKVVAGITRIAKLNTKKHE